MNWQKPMLYLHHLDLNGLLERPSSNRVTDLKRYFKFELLISNLEEDTSIFKFCRMTNA